MAASFGAYAVFNSVPGQWGCTSIQTAIESMQGAACPPSRYWHTLCTCMGSQTVAKKKPMTNGTPEEDCTHVLAQQSAS